MAKWICTVIQRDEKYRAVMEIMGKSVEDLPTDVDYRTLYEAIRLKTGISILKRKDMIFEKLSDFEKIATLDATQYRGVGTDCRVTIKERINGWKPDWS